MGHARFTDLVGRPFAARVDGRTTPAPPTGFFRTGSKQLVAAGNGRRVMRLRLTADHRVKRCRAAHALPRRTREWCAAGELRPGDLVALNDHRANPSWSGELTLEEGYLARPPGRRRHPQDRHGGSLGLATAAAVVNATVCPVSTASWPKPCARRGRCRIASISWAGVEVAGRNEHRLIAGALKTLAERLGMQPRQQADHAAMERGLRASSISGFLRGFFDADGSVQGSQRKGRQRSARAVRSAAPGGRAAHAASPRHCSDSLSTSADLRASAGCLTAAEVTRTIRRSLNMSWSSRARTSSSSVISSASRTTTRRRDCDVAIADYKRAAQSRALRRPRRVDR